MCSALIIIIIIYNNNNNNNNNKTTIRYENIVPLIIQSFVNKYITITTVHTHIIKIKSSARTRNV
jgi:hypothetical protein